jgi:hypothetical protein
VNELNARAEKGEKGNVPFSNSTYIIGYEYRRARTVRPASSYICWFPVKIDEYKFIFIGFKTDENKFIFISFEIDEYNLNIFIRIDKFKNLMNDIFL